MALNYSGQQVELREVHLKDKPEAMLAVSRKGTVPVLVLENGQVIDESWEIILWATEINDPDIWRGKNGSLIEYADRLIRINDSVFKGHLDRYKYADRFPERTQEYYRSQCEETLAHLDSLLTTNRYLLSNNISIADIGIFPFIRQFALVDIDWFQASKYQQLYCWLNTILESDLFKQVMVKLPPWKDGVK